MTVRPFVFRFRKLVAPSKNMYYTNSVYIQLFAKSLIKNIKCKRDHLGCNLSLSINKSCNVALYIVFLRICKWPTNYYFKNKLRTIQPRRLGKIKNCEPESKFYWFL